MASKYWFRKRTSNLDFGRPANWKGWTALMAFVFVFAMVAQLIARWAMIGFAPLATGVWLIAILFLLIGGYFSLAKRFSPPQDDI